MPARDDDPTSGILRLRLPVLQAPMFLVSSATLAAACCRAGLVGSFQLGNPTSTEELDEWLVELGRDRIAADGRGDPFGPYCVNINAASLGRPGYDERFERCAAHGVPLVLSSTGDPTEIVARVHAWGGRVIHDVTTMRFAERAIAADVDGLMLTCAGAGGHTGTLSPFAFLPQVRQRFDGLVVLAGGIADGAGIRGALSLGADMVCMGTRFVATRESVAPDGYKQMIAASETADVLETDAIAGLSANWLVPSIVANGLDPAALPRPTARFRPDLPDGVRAWKTVWSAGHSAGLIHDVPTVAELADRLVGETGDGLVAGWQQRIRDRLG